MGNLTHLIEKSKQADAEMVEGIKAWFTSFDKKVKVKPKHVFVQEDRDTALRVLKPEGVTVGSYDDSACEVVDKKIYTTPYEELNTLELRWAVEALDAEND